jgi:hypothetical protein
MVFFITGLATAAANFYRPSGFQQIMAIQKCIHYPHLNGKIAPGDGNASLESLSGFSWAVTFAFSLTIGLEAWGKLVLSIDLCSSGLGRTFTIAWLGTFLNVVPAILRASPIPVTM